ncbi:MAG: hypothetical protein ABR543_15560 [Gemmatimonadaceae bacterium]
MAAPAPPELQTPAAVLDETEDSLTQTSMQNVHFRVAPGVALRIRRLRGQMVSKTPGEPVIFDDKRTFLIRIATADVGLSTDDLGNLMNNYVFGYRGAPLKNLQFAAAGPTRLKQKGVMHKVVDIPFEMTAELSLTPEGLIRIHPVEMNICGIDGQGLLKALGLELDDLLDLRQAKGATVKGNDLFLDPEKILPPPAIEGRITAVKVEGDEVVQTFGVRSGEPTPKPLSPPDSTALNYMFFGGGTVRFGKLFMVKTDMQIVDADPSDPFDFSIDEYNRQLVAGYSKNLPDMGLEVFMPDLRDIEKARD